MKLNVKEKIKADNYTGDSITYNLPTFNLSQKLTLLKKIQQINEIDPVKIKIEYLDIEEKQQVDSAYGKSLTKNDYLKYKDVNYAKIKGLLNGVRVSFTVDFLDNYLRIKGDYKNDFSEKTIHKLAEEITQEII